MRQVEAMRAQDRILRLGCERKAVIAGGVAVEPVFPKCVEPTAGMDTTQGQDVLGT